MSSKQKKLYTPFVLNPRHGKAYNKTKYTILKTKAIFFIRPEISPLSFVSRSDLGKEGRSVSP